jgi:hypothetical protein
MNATKICGVQLTKTPEILFTARRPIRVQPSPTSVLTPVNDVLVKARLQNNKIIISNNGSNETKPFDTIRAANNHVHKLKQDYGGWIRTGPCFPQKN